jgi:hypothetical protein
MAADEPLKPEDLRAQIQQEKIVKNDGKQTTSQIA